MRTTRPLAPERTVRCGASITVATSLRRRIAAVRSALSKAAVSRAYPSSLGREVPSGNAGRAIAARIAIMATTQMISTRVKPACRSARSTGPAGDVARGARATFLPVRAVGDAVIGTVLSRQPVDIGLAPRVAWNDGTLPIRTIPSRQVARALQQ